MYTEVFSQEAWLAGVRCGRIPCRNLADLHSGACCLRIPALRDRIAFTMSSNVFRRIRQMLDNHKWNINQVNGHGVGLAVSAYI